MTNTKNIKRPDKLAALEVLKRELERIQHQIGATVASNRADGTSWATIGHELGISKQAAQQKYGKHVSPEMLAVEASLTDEEIAGASVTPSIFLDPIAPATPGASAKKTVRDPERFFSPIPWGIEDFHKAEKKRKAKIRQQTDEEKEIEAGGHILRTKYKLPGEMPTHAEPGTGKGAHQCIGCGSTNHKGVTPQYVYFNSDCAPTKYDPQRITDYMMEQNK